MSKRVISAKVKHRFTLDASDDPAAFCSLEPFMNYQLPKNPKLVRTWAETTCGYCHHLLNLGKRPIDRSLREVTQ